MAVRLDEEVSFVVEAASFDTVGSSCTLGLPPTGFETLPQPLPEREGRFNPWESRRHRIVTVREPTSVTLRTLGSCLSAHINRLHRDERGSISLLTVFATLLFTMLLVSLVNLATHLDDKLKMQNAADAATYSGGVVLARGMNAISFTNHLEADVFALTAFLREARDRNAEKFVPDILAKWNEMSRLFGAATFAKFPPLMTAIPAKTPLEQEFVTAWAEMAAAAAEYALPVFEHILGTPETVFTPTNDHLIPNFQQAVLDAIPLQAHEVTNEIALRHGLRQGTQGDINGQMRFNPRQSPGDRSPQFGLLWRTNVLPVGIGDETDPETRTLPVVDPHPLGRDYARLPLAGDYVQEARKRRSDLAHDNLSRWIHDRDPTKGLDFADEEARMSQFARLFWTAACSQLERLLNVEYPNTNLPMLMRMGADEWTNSNLEAGFMYVGVVYREHLKESGPGLYRNPLSLQSDTQTFASVQLFIPRGRFRCCPWIVPNYGEDERSGEIEDYSANGDNWSHAWNTFNQNWMVRLVPATAQTIPAILQTQPGGDLDGFRPPNLGGLTMRELDAINTH